MRKFKHHLPGCALVILAAILPHLASLRPSLPVFLPFCTSLVFGAGILLGWRFDRSRIVLSLATLALAERALTHGDAIVFKATAVLLPLNLAFLAWLKERGVFTRRGGVKIIVLAVEALLVLSIHRPWLAPVRAWLDHIFVASPLLARVNLPQSALAACAAGFFLVALRYVLHPTTLDGGALWAWVASTLALAAQGATRIDLYITAAGLALVVSLIEASYGMAFIDDLTGLPGRRALNEELLKLSGQFAIAMVDIDHFKRFNDEHGHDIGDQLLRRIGSRLAGVGGDGQAFRYGGEEFAVIFPHKTFEEAVPFMETVRKHLANTPFFVRRKYRPKRKPKSSPTSAAGWKKVSVTVSIGVASPKGAQTLPWHVIKAADVALYRAKRGGRNRLCV